MDENSKAQASVTVSDFDKLVEELKLVYDEQEQKKAALSEVTRRVEILEAKCVLYLKELKRDNFQTPWGTPYVIQRWRVKLPENDVEKKKLFGWLEEQGEQVKMKYLTVNSNSLNSLYSTMKEEAIERGEMFSLPGIAPPSLYETLGFRKGKS
jgi:hypothetical protein